MNEIISQFLSTVGAYLPSVLAALGILIGGWILAVIVAGITRRLIQRTKFDRWLASVLGEDTTRLNISHWVSRAVYYLILLFVIVGVLQALNLGIVAEPINQLLGQMLAYLPQIIGAAALLLVAWLLATALKYIITRMLKAVQLDDRLYNQAGIEATEGSSLSETMGNVIYWLVFVLFLPAILGALGLQGLLFPVQNMIDEVLGALPDILGAGLVLLLGWFGARIVRQIVANLLSGLGVDRVGEDTGISSALGDQKLSQVIATIVYVLILIPVVIGALNALGASAISQPAAQMLTTLLAALPALFGAVLLIGIAYFVARIVGNFISNVLTGIGFNKVLTWIGLGVEPVEGQQTPSQIVGYLATVGIMLFAVTEAANLLGFAILAQLVSDFLVATGGVLLGLVIFGLGLYLAGLADRVIRSAGGSQARLLAPVARVAIIVFSGALALRQTGIAEDIVNLAFGLVLGALAVAAALAFGLGSREIAGQEVTRWLKSRHGAESAEK
jgi:hypothetical protein